nr:cellulase family glycosylhydrolase [Saccharothrix deserti]
MVEANGQKFIMRGVNHPHVWFPARTGSFAEIKALGANTVRVVLGSGKRWGPSTDVAEMISLCKRNRMICVLEVHDTTGYGEDGAAATLDEAANYWISQKNVLVGQEDYVVINIGNQWPAASRVRSASPREARRPQPRRDSGASALAYVRFTVHTTAWNVQPT